MKIQKLYKEGFGPFSKRLVNQLQTISDLQLRTRYALFFHYIINFFDQNDCGKMRYPHSAESIDKLLGKFNDEEVQEIHLASGTMTKTKTVTHKNRDEFFKVFSWCLFDKTKDKMKPKRLIDLDKARGTQSIKIPHHATYEKVVGMIEKDNKKWVCTEGLSLNVEGLSTRQELNWAAAINQNTDSLIWPEHFRWSQMAGSNIPKEWFTRFNERLVEIDVKAAQAHLLLLALFSIDGKKVSSHWVDNIIDTVNANTKRRFNGKEEFKRAELMKDFDAYRAKIATTADPYQMIADEVLVSCPIVVENELKVNRDSIKTQFNFFICKEGFQGETIPLCWWMNKHFPILYDFVCDYKFSNKKSNENTEHILYNKMFGALGKLFHEIITRVQHRSVMKTKKSVPFIYRYDAVWVLESDLDLWLDAFNVKFSKYELEPTVTLSYNCSSPDGSEHTPSNYSFKKIVPSSTESTSCSSIVSSIVSQSHPSYSRHGANDTKKHDTKKSSLSSTSAPIGPSGAQVKEITLDQIRVVNNNGSSAWMYRGTGKQQMKASCKQVKTKEEFLAKVNEKFIKGEWK